MRRTDATRHELCATMTSDSKTGGLSGPTPPPAPKLLIALKQMVSADSEHSFADARVVAADGVADSYCLLLSVASDLLKEAIAEANDASGDWPTVIVCPDLAIAEFEAFNDVLLGGVPDDTALVRSAADLFCVKGVSEECFDQQQNEPAGVEPSTEKGRRKGGRFPCSEPDCGAILSTAYALKVHLSSSSHRGQRPHMCPVCERGFAQRCHLTVHLRTHSGERGFMCAVCGKTFSVPSNLRKHQQGHQREEEAASHVCEFCAKIYSKLSDLHLHLRTHTAEDSARPFPCELCSSNPFSTRSALAMHKRAAHGDDSGGGRFSCSLCSRVWPSRSALEKHLLVHSGDKPHACPVCEKRFSQVSHVNYHVRTVHEKAEKPRNHVCGECGKAFAARFALSKHEKTHTNERPFKCDICDKGFIQKTHLQAHTLKHNGERPFLCGVCGKSYVTKAHLKEHSKQHRGERRYHACPDCGVQYANQFDLNVHRRHHTGEMPFQCDKCGKGFRAKRKLADHARRHTGDRPFHCTNCNKSFAFSGSLRSHFRRHDTCRLTATEGAYVAKKDSAVDKEGALTMAVEESAAPVPFEGIVGKEASLTVETTHADVDTEAVVLVPPALIGGVTAADLMISPSAAAASAMLMTTSTRTDERTPAESAEAEFEAYPMAGTPCD